MLTQTEKVQLADDLIKENPNTTIKDYLDTLQEIETIMHAQQKIIPNENRLHRTPNKW